MPQYAPYGRPKGLSPEEIFSAHAKHLIKTYIKDHLDIDAEMNEIGVLHMAIDDAAISGVFWYREKPEYIFQIAIEVDNENEEVVIDAYKKI